ncbi:beta-ketoacyl-ACP synthase III [Streptomyces sp. NPDC047108]|uniref:beta-ketoacyl-ACP synthase III n=1 Tax=Streptomyces sp. NPDC047108 TaxID=3155025 RepID=UPI0034058109
MNNRHPRSAVLTGVGSWLPPETVTNADLEAVLDTDDAWIRTRTGIASRRRVSPDMATSDLAVEAGRRALASAGGPPADAVVLATSTPDRLCPATAPDVASRLGLPDVAAYDVSAVCSGFLYGLASAAGLIATGTADRVLLIAAEAFTTLIDPKDRTTAVLFGDGAGAVVLRAGHPDEPGAVGPLVLGSDGSGKELLSVPGGGSLRREPSDRHPRHVLMPEGAKLYRHAVARMTAASRTALERAGWQPGDVDRLVTHQANARINTALGDALEVPVDRRATNIERVGNTAGASIPLLLDEEHRSGVLTAGQRVLIAGFGAGLSWGATTLVWPSLRSSAAESPLPAPVAHAV